MGIQPRYNHTASMFGTKLVIFGGLGQHMTFQMDAEEIEFDVEKVQRLVKRMSKDSERKKKQEMKDLYAEMFPSVASESRK